MLKYIGGIEAYDFFINLGSVIGSILLIVLYYRKNRSWKKTAEVYLLAFAILEVGMFAGRLVRGLSYGEEWNIFHHTAKRKSFHWACAVYNVGFPGFVPGDFPKGERGVDGISGSSVCFPCISAYFQPDRLPV